MTVIWALYDPPYKKLGIWGEGLWGSLDRRGRISRHKSHMRRFLGFWSAILGSVFVPMGLPIWISGILEDFTWGIRVPNTPPLPSILGLP